MGKLLFFTVSPLPYADIFNMTFDISPKTQKIIYINKAGKSIEGFCFLFPTFVSSM